jgi:UDP-N-acetylmuramoylalanine--D-glutamate ligase
VYGLGRSGAGAARLLVELGARVHLFDDGSPTSERLAALGLEDFETPVAPTPEAIAALDALVVSPGVPPNAPGRVEAHAAEVPVLGELELALAQVDARVTVVTGSHGKSTVTTWLAELHEAAGRRAVACGNLGRPVSEVVLDGERPEELVVEASSFQLHDSPRMRVDAAVFTAYAPNHLDWHPDEEHYRASKLALLDRLAPGARVAFVPGFPGLEDALRRHQVEAVVVGDAGAYGLAGSTLRTPEGVVDLAGLPGPAALSAPAVALAAAAAGAAPATVARAAPRVEALPHRLEDLGEKGGRRYVNDSKATTPAAAAYALERVTPPVVLILGGKDKGLRFEPLAERFAAAHTLVFTGACKPRLVSELGDLTYVATERFDEALEAATGACPRGGTVLLAPGCSSFDEFPNFEARGERFRAYVDGLSAHEEAA